MIVSDIRKTIKLSEQEALDLLNDMTSVRFKRGETIDGQNELLQNVIFIASGSARTYYIENDREHNFAFSFGPHLLIVPHTLIQAGDYRVFVQFMEPTEVCYVPMKRVGQIIDESENSYKLISVGLIKYLEFLERHMLLLRMPATERYRTIVENNPHILDVVTITQLASYLNVTKETLYRIRSGKY